MESRFGMELLKVENWHYTRISQGSESELQERLMLVGVLLFGGILNIRTLGRHAWLLGRVRCQRNQVREKLIVPLIPSRSDDWFSPRNSFRGLGIYTPALFERFNEPFHVSFQDVEIRAE